jgi:hypothetical protein
MKPCILIGWVVFFSSLTETVLAERLLKAQVHLDGKLILEGSTSDDGTKTPDEVWQRLKEIEFRIPKGSDISIDDSLEIVKINKAGRLEIRYGGMIEFTSLNIRPSKREKGTWKIEQELIEKWSKDRWVRKRDYELNRQDP